MKKALILLIVLLMAFEGLAVHAESDTTAPADAAQTAAKEAETDEQPEEGEAPADTEAEEDIFEPIVYDYNELTVGAVTPFDGKFFTQMWGNVATDLDVRALIHGYDLVEWRVEDGVFAIDPSVVSGIVVTENPAGDRTYTLTLYNDLYYSDNTQITAWDYAFSMLLSVAPEIAEIGGSPRPKDYLVGYEAYENGDVPYLAGVRVLADDTIAITVSNEYLPFFYELALLDCAPYPISVIAPGCRVADDGQGVYITNEDETIEESLFTADLLRETILNEETGYLSHPSVTSGPYRLVSFDGQTVEMEINEYYKGNSDGELPLIPRLIYKTVSIDTMVDQLATGEVGLLNKCVSADVIQQATQLLVRSENNFALSNYTRNGMLFISFCCEQEPVNDLAVRQAVALCMDKEGIVGDTVMNYGLRVDGYYGMGQWMYQLIDGTTAYPVEDPGADADQAALEAYDAEMAEWEALNMDDVQVYDLNVAEAVALLEENGWTLNRDGEAFDPEKDDVRCKDVDGVIVPLELKMICPEGSSANEALQANFADHLAEAGILLDIEIMPMQELLRYYYRLDERDCDMVMLATNFDILFDPSVNFMPDGEETINPYNTTAISDEALYNLTVDMRQTSPDDVIGYCRKWIDFETRFQELVPVISVYSNVYFDFYPRVLHNYDVSSNVTWGQAIIGAYMSDASDEELAGEENAEGDLEIIG